MRVISTNRNFNPHHNVKLNSHFNRRNFLKALGVAGGMLPFVPILNASTQESSTPKRLILLFTPHGAYLPTWTPTGTKTDFVLSKSLAPLAKYQSKMNVLYGVGMRGGFHQNGQSQLYTGTYLYNADGSEPNTTTLPLTSIDQLIANAIGKATVYPYLGFGVNTSTGVGCRAFWNNGQMANMMQDPRSTFNQLFTQVTGQTLTDQTSVLDAVNANLKTLQGKISKADLPKVQAHLQAITDLEKRLKSQSAICKGPTFTGSPTWERNGDAGMEGGFAASIAMATSALACDLTRVVTLEFSMASNDGHTYPWLGINNAHHSLTHANPSDTQDINGVTVANYADSVNGQLTSIHTWYSQMIATMCDQLAAVPEGNGTMLDNTLIVWGTELAHCFTHSNGPGIPLVTIGGLGGTVTTGRWLDYTANPQLMNRFLVSICGLYGLTNTTVGNTPGHAGKPADPYGDSGDPGTGPLIGF